MATKVRIEFIGKGWRECLFDQRCKALVYTTADSLAARAGDGYESVHFIGDFGGGRPVGLVKTGTQEAREDQARNKTLNKLL